MKKLLDAKQTAHFPENTTGDRWGLTEVTVTLTGEEWTALLGRIAGNLSPLGAQIYSRAAGKMQKQLIASSEAYKRNKGRKITAGGSIECPHCHFGFAPSVIEQHIREKH